MKENYLIARVIAPLKLLYFIYFCEKSDVAIAKILKFLLSKNVSFLATDKDLPGKGFSPILFYII